VLRQTAVHFSTRQVEVSSAEKAKSLPKRRRRLLKKRRPQSLLSLKTRRQPTAPARARRRTQPKRASRRSLLSPRRVHLRRKLRVARKPKKAVSRPKT